jgi:hypothetical protein
MEFQLLIARLSITRFMRADGVRVSCKRESERRAVSARLVARAVLASAKSNPDMFPGTFDRISGRGRHEEGENGSRLSAAGNHT